MKTKIIISLAILMLFGAWKNEKETLTILSGILPALKNESISLLPVQDHFPGFIAVDTYPTVKTDSLGRFIFRFTSSNSNFYQIINNNSQSLRYDIYIEPGDSLFIEQSLWSESPKFLISGKGSDKLKYLEKDYSIVAKSQAVWDRTTSTSFDTELDFKRVIDSIHFEKVNALTSLEGVPDFLRDHHLMTLNAKRAESLLEHLERRNYDTKGEFDYFYPDDNYINFLDSIDFNSDFAKTKAARSLTQSYLNYQARQAFKYKTDEEWWEEILSWKFRYISNLPASLWKDILALSTIEEYSFGLETDNFITDLEIFENNITKMFFSETSKILFEVNIKPFKDLLPGKLAPDFELPDSSGVMHRLSDFKGNIVYLDFWGTWCYPCILEIPDALDLQEKYKDEPVIFLYVSLEYDNTDIDGWKEFIAGKNQRFGKFLNNKPFPGVHLVAEKQIRNEAISPYKLNYVPTFVLIDQNGNIVKARAQRSSTIQEEIDELLKTMK
jgi:thiol-disulfide isomerase/thioredoxin